MTDLTDADILIAFFSLLAILVALVVVWIASYQLLQTRRMECKFSLFAARDHLYRLVAAGRLRCEDDAFVAAVRWINTFIHMHERIGVEHLVELHKTAAQPEVRQAAKTAMASWKPDELLEFAAVMDEVGRAIVALAKVNSRIFRLLAWSKDHAPKNKRLEPQADEWPALSLTWDNIARAA